MKALAAERHGAQILPLRAAGRLSPEREMRLLTNQLSQILARIDQLTGEINKQTPDRIRG